MVRVDRLDENDWAVFREIRLRSLLDSPDAFGSTYGEESSRAERAWRDWAAGRWRGGIAAVFAGFIVIGAVPFPEGSVEVVIRSEERRVGKECS